MSLRRISAREVTDAAPDDFARRNLVNAGFILGTRRATAWYGEMGLAHSLTLEASGGGWMALARIFALNRVVSFWSIAGTKGRQADQA